MENKNIISQKIIYTHHSIVTLSKRRINVEMVEKALEYGRHIYANGAHICFVGKKEVKRAKNMGVNIQNLDGLNLIMQEQDGKIILVTGFKNSSLKRYKH